MFFCLYVCAFVQNFGQKKQIGPKIFLVLGGKKQFLKFLAWSYNNIKLLKLTGIIFQRKLLFQGFWDKRGENVPKVSWKIVIRIFLRFCIKLQQHINLALIFTTFCERACFVDFGPKWAQNGSKMRFFRLYEKSKHGTFLFCCCGSCS